MKLQHGLKEEMTRERRSAGILRVKRLTRNCLTIMFHNYIVETLGSIYRDGKLTLKRIKRRLRSPVLPESKDGRVYIHLGCGEINAPGFINVDAIPLPHVHYVQEVEDLSIFPNEYADLVYASHILEHISHQKITKVLKEWHRILKKGGVLRLSVPDFDKVIEIYLSEERNIKTIIMPLMGGQDYTFNFHKTVFNENYLTEFLLSVGFNEVREWEYQKVQLHSFEDWASRPIEIGGRKYLISLNIEAVK